MCTFPPTDLVCIVLVSTATGALGTISLFAIAYAAVPVAYAVACAVDFLYEKFKSIFNQNGESK